MIAVAKCCLSCKFIQTPAYSNSSAVGVTFKRADLRIKYSKYFMRRVFLIRSCCSVNLSVRISLSGKYQSYEWQIYIFFIIAFSKLTEDFV